MSFYVNRKGDLEYLTADTLAGTAHCFSTRFGGVSEGMLSSLNLGVHRGDRPCNVLENYRRLGAAVGFSLHDTVFTKQVHSAVIAHVGRGERGRGLILPVEEPCDGLITNEPGVALTVFSADCTPILLYDPIARAIGAVHAGWRGTAAGIAAVAVSKMREAFGCKEENLRAAIGPCISQCCFETSADVPRAMLDVLGSDAQPAIRPSGEKADKFYVNLKLLNELWLRRAGVGQIAISEDCTACQPTRFWSHRVVGNKRGSLAAVIMLKDERSGGAM
ncbi:MAG: peptidoglycan editing factor PgeF [Oscillospiraceae bacterium]|jgi:YfiH family protein|nr:peptidoglycan editing factor PgeF [Oscillospiraceae bacterium]